MRRRGDGEAVGAPPRQRPCVAMPGQAVEARGGGPPVAAGAAAGAAAPGLNSKLTTNDALTYLRDVKNMFTTQREVYETFLEIMKEFKAQTIDTYGVIQRVKQLFKGNKNLIIGFNTFLPKGFEIRMEDLLREEAQEQQMAAGKQPVEFDQAINYVNKIKDRFRTDESVYKNFLEILNQYRKAQRGIKEVYDQVAYLFRDHDDLLEEFTYFLPDSQAPHRAAMERQRLAAAQREHETCSRRPRVRSDAVQPYDFQRDCAAMFEKIRRRVANSTWNDFMKVLMMYVDGIIGEIELQDLVSCVIGTASNDLVSMFEDFMRRAPNLEFGEEVIDAITKAVTNKTSSHYAAKDKYLRLPISEVIDPARCEKLSVSYIQVPADYPKLNFSARKKLPIELQQLPLNNNWVSVTQGSEDYSFRSMRRNQFEEALFRIEDDRYDLELLIERNNSVLRKVDSLLEKLAAISDEMMSIRFEEDAFTTIQKRHIYTVYGSGDQAETMFNALLGNPQEALPVVRDRLIAKGTEWSKVLSEMESYWQRQFNQNYTRSLDHRSFYFKVVDKKLLGQRYIIQEIKEAAEQTQAHPEAALGVHTSAPSDIKLRPHLLLDMPDLDVHGDVWALVQIGFVGSESITQVEQFWRQIVLPFFGISNLDSVTPEFGPPSPAATGDVDRCGPVDTPVDTPAPSQDASGAVAGGAEQSGASSRENNTAPSTGASSEAVAEGAAANTSAEVTPFSSGQDAGGSPPAAPPAGSNGPSASVSAEAADTGQNGTVQMEVDNVEGMRGGNSDEPESDDAEMAPEVPDPGQGAPADVDEEMAVDDEERGADGGDDDEDTGGDPEASEASKLEESDVDEVEESGTISGAKGAKADAVDDEDDDEDDPAAHGLLSSPSKLPIDFNHPAKVGQDGFPLEPCPVRSQPPSELRPIKIPGQPEVKEVLELYCNEAMYGFWRLYHYCYERLQVARTCILEKHGKSSRTAMQGSSDVEKASAGETTASQQGSGDAGPPQVSPPGQGGNGSCDSEEVRAMRKKFFQLLYSHIVHKTDVTVFEDTCRSMLGANSFVLFTIQKLVLKLARHLASVIADDSSVKLINLHHYEKRRRQPVHWSVRLANAAQTHNEDHAIRLASREDGSIAVTWVDFDRMEPSPWPCDPDARSFLDAYMKVSESDVAVHQKQRNSPTLFLKRSLHSSIRNSDSAKRMEHLGKFYMRNGLESKLKQDDGSSQKDTAPTSRKSVSNRRFSYKFNFVLDTEDAMMCCQKRKRPVLDAKQLEVEQRKNLQTFQQRLVDKNTPAEQRVDPGAAAAAVRPQAPRV